MRSRFPEHYSDDIKSRAKKYRPWLNRLGRGLKKSAKGVTNAADKTASTTGKVLSSPAFWGVVGAGAATYGLIEWDRSLRKRYGYGLFGAPSYYAGAPAYSYSVDPSDPSTISSGGPFSYTGYGYTNPNHILHRGYFRNGTYVPPSWQTAPNNTMRDNFSADGNINPYTGKPGWIYPRY